MLSIIGIKKTIKQYTRTADMDITDLNRVCYIKAHTQWRQRHVDVKTLMLTSDLEIQNNMHFIVDRSQ
jgi:hypothetical protein